MFELGWIADLDAEGTCAAVSAAHRQLLEQEATLLVLATHWADLHNGDVVDSTGRVLPGMEQAKRLGGPGTPPVLEFAAAELGALQGISTISAQRAMADGLNLRHRHPRLWELVTTGAVRAWKAVRVARATAEAGLSLEQARWVDAQTSDYISGLGWGRFEQLLAAKIIEADPAAADARRAAAEAEQYVSLGRANEHGLKTLIAKGKAGDVLALVASANLIAEILAEFGDTDPVGARRAKALGILANPLRAEALLRQYAAHQDTQTQNDTDPGAEQDTAPDSETDSNTEDDSDAGAGDASSSEHDRDPDAGDGELGLIGEGDLHPGQNDADDPDPVACGSCGGTGTEPWRMSGNPLAFVKRRVQAHRSSPGGRAAEAVDSLDWRRVMPRVVFYVHLSQEALHRHTTGHATGADAGGVARIEGIGPVTLVQLREFLGDHTGPVTVKGVVDVAGQVPVDAYETPDRMREAMCLLQPGDVFPFGSHLGRSKDLDHVQPYLDPGRGGPPGQTHPGNLAPLTRLHHRMKTHARWCLRQDGPGVYLWRSPHGYFWQVDATGTHPLTREAGRAYWHSLTRPRHRPEGPPQRIIDVDIGRLPFTIHYDTAQHTA